MTQPNSAQSVLNRQDVFRLYQQVLSPGAIYEIDNPALAVWIGPNSDLSEVRLQYPSGFTPDLVDQAQVADVSVGGPFVGRMDALLDTPYGSTGQLSRILAYPVDIVDPAYIRPPASAAATPTRRFNLPAYIDLICALEIPSNIPQQRADRTFRLPRVPFDNAAGGLADDGSTDIVIPIYGRRMVTVQIQTPVGVGHDDSYYLAALQPGTTQIYPKFLGTVLTGAASISQTDSVVYRASDQYNQDQVDVTGSTSVPTTFLWTQVTGPLSPCKGMADLLIINLKANFGGGPPPAGYSLVSVFVKVSDREE